MNDKEINIQKGVSLEADFQKNTWIFEMKYPFSVRSGHFIIIHESDFDEIIKEYKIPLKIK